MGGEVEGWEPPLLASAPPPLSLCTALERVVAGFKLFFLFFFVFFCICSFADDDDDRCGAQEAFRRFRCHLIWFVAGAITQGFLQYCPSHKNDETLHVHACRRRDGAAQAFALPQAFE